MPRGIPNTKRVSREQETWSADAIHDDFSSVAEADGPLPNIPARNGFSQRWIRSKIGGENDSKNLSTAYNNGWRRRDPATVPPTIAAPSVYVEGVGDSVGISGMILMERPEKLSAVHKQRVQQRTNTQMEAVDKALENSHTANSGFGAPTRSGKTETQTGSMPIDD